MGYLMYGTDPDNNTVELQTDANKNLKVVAQALAGTVLNVLSAAITANAIGANLTVGTFKELAIDVNVSAITGTTPTYQLIVERLGADGVWYSIYTGTAISSVGVISVSMGASLVTNVSFGNTIRIHEVLSGTTPSVTRSLSIIGK